MSLDLSKDWDNSTIQFKALSKPSDMPNLNAGILWYHKSENVVYSGPAGDPALYDKFLEPIPLLSLWSLKPDGRGGGSWTEAEGPESNIWQNVKRSTRAFTAQGADTGWILNGAEFVDGDPISGMLQIDMGETKITNITENPYSELVQQGQMQYVPTWGSKGLLVAFAGRSNFIDVTGGTKVPVFDIAQGKWYDQATTGDQPKWRFWYCAAGVESTNGTFEIFIYGGHILFGSNAIQYDTVHILTLPAFHWTKAPYKARYARAGHTCTPVGGSQILVLGGSDVSIDSTKAISDEADGKADFWIQDQNTMSSADPWKQGLGVFDMSTLAWKDAYDASPAEYKQADVIRQYYDEAQK